MLAFALAPRTAPFALRVQTVVCARRRVRTRVRAHPCSCATPDAVEPSRPIEIAAAPEPSPPPSRSEAVKVRAARAVWRVGWLAWWLQLVLTAVSVVILLFAFTFPGVAVTRATSAPGLILSGTAALAALISWVWTYVYTRVSLRLCLVPPAPLSRLGGSLRFGVVLSLVGFVLGLLALQATVGTLLARLFAAGAGAGAAVPATAGSGAVLVNPSAVQPVDLLVVQATVNAMCSLCAGLLATLWLQSRLNQWREEEGVWKSVD